MIATSHRETALNALGLNLSVLPPEEDSTKRPLCDGIDPETGRKTWKHRQTDAATLENIEDWYHNGRTGVGLVCGAVSGGLELFEFDDRPTYEAFKKTAAEVGLGELVERIEAGYLEETPGGGIHWFYYASEVRSSTKLARRPEGTHKNPNAIKGLIETKGEGGFVIIAPSSGRVHPSGKPYRLLQGSLETIATITDGDREALWALAQTFDEMPDLEAAKEVKPGKFGRRTNGSQDVLPGTDYNQRTQWSDILPDWRVLSVRGDVTLLKRPGKDEPGCSASIRNGRLNVYTTSTPFEPVLTSRKTYDRFGAYALLHHKGDLSAAARALVEQGYGQKTDIRPQAEPDSPNATDGPEKQTDPHRLARIVQRTIGLSVDGPHIKYWDEQWWAWDGLRWVTVSDAEMSARICCVLKAEFDQLVAGTDQPPRPISTGLIGNVAAALRGLCLVRKDLTPEQPAWLDGYKGPKPLECFATTTGIIHLPTLIAKGPTDPGAVMPLTPRFFSAAALDYGFNPSAPEPKHWLAFLKSIWPDDQESIDCLQEWFGLFLTAETRYQKILMVLGPKRAGKGTIANTLRSLVGYSNVVAPTLGSLATQFGLQALIGKRVAMTTDARLSGRVDSQQIVERLLSISGEDPQSIDRKHINAWHGTLNVRFALMGTELPRLGDVSGGLTGRMIVLCLKKTWLGNEDLELQTRIRGELPGIQLWSIDGYHRLRERGRFLQPASGAEILEEFEELSNPVGVFLAEKCDLGPEHEVLKTDLYASWQLWCKERGKEHISDQSGFGRNLRSALPSLKTPRHRNGVKIANYYGGVNLTESALMEVEEHRQQLEKLKQGKQYRSDQRGEF